MAKQTFPVTAVVIRVITLTLGIALFIEQAGVRQVNSLVYWAGLLAPAFFLWALWAASGVFVRIERGDAFGPAMVRGLREIGAGLMLGAFCAIVVEPSVAHLVGNGFREMRGVKFNLNVQNLTLALVGLVMILLARQGEKLKSNLEQFV